MHVRVERSSRETMEQTLRAAEDEGQGAWQIGMVVPQNGVVEDKQGDDFEARAHAMVKASLDEMRKQPAAESEPARCLLCERTVFRAANMPVACTVLAAQCKAPTKFIVNGVCRDCVEGFDAEEELRQAILAKFRGMMRPRAAHVGDIGQNTEIDT